MSTSPPLETITAGFSFTCGLDSAGAAWCWGSNAYGTLGVGDPTFEHSEMPLRVDAPEPLVELDAGEFSVCGLTASGSAFCWGRNSEGELGNTASESCFGGPCATEPTPAAEGLTFGSIDLGLSHTCGTGTDGQTYCWGWDAFGVDGDGVPGNGGSTPRTVAASVVFSDVSAGATYTCGLEGSGAAYCWGGNFMGELGTGTMDRALTPEPVAGSHVFTRLEAFDANSILGVTCAIDTDQAAWCWGSNEFGELGTEQPVDPECADIPGLGMISCSAVPVPVSGGHAWVHISPGMSYVCGRTSSDEIYCWGRNASGTLGDGTTTDRPQPTLVVIPAPLQPAV